MEKALRQQKQAKQAARYREPAVYDGAPCREHGDAERVGHGTVGQFLAKSRHDEEAVINSEAQPEHGNDVGRIDTDLGEMGGPLEQGHAGDNGGAADDERQRGRHQRTEHPHQQHGQGDETDDFGPLEVAIELFAHVDIHCQFASQPDVQNVAG